MDLHYCQFCTHEYVLNESGIYRIKRIESSTEEKYILCNNETDTSYDHLVTQENIISYIDKGKWIEDIFICNSCETLMEKIYTQRLNERNDENEQLRCYLMNMCYELDIDSITEPSYDIHDPTDLQNQVNKLQEEYNKEKADLDSEIEYLEHDLEQNTEKYYQTLNENERMAQQISQTELSLKLQIEHKKQHLESLFKGTLDDESFVITEMFKIQIIEPFGVINGCRLGTLKDNPVEWEEINLALGHIVMYLNAIMLQKDIVIPEYTLDNVGARSMIIYNSTVYNLYFENMQNTQRLFMFRSFNDGLEYLLRFTYKIYHKIHNVSIEPINYNDIKLENNTREKWTNTLKIFITFLPRLIKKI